MRNDTRSLTLPPKAQRDVLRQELRQRILTGQVQPGEKLPTEHELMDVHGISRHSARLVLDNLAREGLIERTARRGTVVLPNTLKKPTRTITFLSQDIRDAMGSRILAGLQEHITGEEFRLEIVALGDTPEEFRQTIATVLKNPTDGVVIFPLSWMTDQTWAGELRQHGIPFVVVDSLSAGIACDGVATDNVAGGRLAGERLLAQGYRRLYHLAFDTVNSTPEERARGFQQAVVAAAPGSVDLCLPLRHTLTEAAEREHRQPWLAAKQFWLEIAPKLDLRSGPVGVFACSDIEAFGVHQACQQLGLTIGREVGIVGFDDSDLALIANPPLTSVRQYPEQMGSEAARLLIQRLATPDAPYQTLRIPPLLIARDSDRLAFSPPAERGRAPGPAVNIINAR
jgi:GntR family transcriptional regulator, arabinose operon transcriptional repressor